MKNKLNNNVSIPESEVVQEEARLGSLLDRSPYRVNTEDYLNVLRVLAVCNLPDAPLRAERWLHRLEQHAGNMDQHTTNITNDKSNNISNGAFHGYFFQRPLFHSTVVGQVSPTSECYQRVIEAWARATSEDPARVVVRAERWLWKHIESPNMDARPGTACFNAFLDVCTKGRALKSATSNGLKMSLDHAQKAENVLRYMIGMKKQQGSECRVAPNVDSFNLVLRGWTRCRKSFDIADRAMDVLSLLETYQSTVDPTVRPNSATYGMIMDSISVRAKLKVKRSIGPLGKSGRENPSENGMEEILLLKNMLDHFHEKSRGGDLSMLPTTHTYNVLLGCWANIAPLHENGPAEAESILMNMTALKEKHGMTNVSPDSTSYLMVMRAWANCSKSTRGQRVAWLLSKQWKDFHFLRDDNLQPTVLSYNIAIQTWISLKQPLEAEKLLLALLQHSDNNNSNQKNGHDYSKLRVNSESFSLLIRAWLAVADDGSISALMAAAKWLSAIETREQSDSTISSSVELYTLFLGSARKCAAHSAEVMTISLQVFDNLRQSRHLMDCLHYSRMLQIGLLSLSRATNNTTRDKFIEEIVTECKDAGLVSSALLQALADGPTYPDGWTVEESKRVVGEHFPMGGPLPPSWLRNIRQQGQLPKESDLYRRTFFVFHHGVDPWGSSAKPREQFDTAMRTVESQDSKSDAAV